MVEINNQRKAFLDSVGLAWSEGTDNGRQKTVKSWLWRVIVGGELFTDYSDHLSQTCHAKPKLKSTGADATSFFPVGGMFTGQAAWPERLLSESQDAVVLQQIKERGAYLWLIVVISVRAIDRCSNIWASLPGAGYGQLEHKAYSPIAKFSSGRNGQRDSLYEQSHRDYLRSGYLHHRLPVMGC